MRKKKKEYALNQIIKQGTPGKNLSAEELLKMLEAAYDAGRDVDIMETKFKEEKK